MRLSPPRPRAFAAALAVVIVALVTAPAGRADAVRHAVQGVHYARIEPICTAPTPGHAACMALSSRPAPAADANASYSVNASYPVGPHGGYTPADLQTAYGVSGLSATAGAGQTVAIVDAYGDSHIQSDLNAFDTLFDLPACGSGCLNVYDQTGQTSPLPADDPGWDGEIALDVETVHSICELCTIDLVEGNSAQYSDLAVAEDTAARLGATEITNSFGGPEQPLASDPMVAATDHPGVAIFVSAGDYGYDEWNDSDFGKPGVPQQPSSLPTVISVGGTSLQLNANATRAGETVWNDGDGQQNADGASGGGCSAYSPAPPWQLQLPDWGRTGCGNRLDNDVSAVADPLTGVATYDQGWSEVGGTSLSSPLMAAMMALAGGPGGIDDPARTIYANFAATPSDFNDVTSGGDGQCDGRYTGSACTTGGSFTPATDCGLGVISCNAASGYDGPTGVGTPDGVAGLVAASPTAVISPPAGPTATTPSAFSGSGSSAPPGATLTAYSWSFGDGATAGGEDVSHAYASPGTYTVTLTVSDGARTATATATVTVAAAPSPAATPTTTTTTTGGGSSHTASSPRLSPGHIAKRGSAVLLAMSCGGATDASCHGEVRVLARVRSGRQGRRREVTLASGRVALSGGGATVLRLRLTGAGRRLLAHSGVSATLVVTDRSGGSPVVSSTRVTLGASSRS